MATRIIAQLIVTGAQIFGKAFYTAFQQTLKNGKVSEGMANAAVRGTKLKMSTDEALKILNIQRSDLTKEILEANYKKYFEANNPSKGGSFYLQSKIYRSKEALDQELAIEEAEKKAAEELKNNPKKPSEEPRRDRKARF